MTLIRIHNKARRGLFTPNRVKGCPVDPSRISHKRITVANFSNGETQTINHQDYKSPKLNSAPLHSKLTGQTIFKVLRTPYVPCGESHETKPVPRGADAVTEHAKAAIKECRSVAETATKEQMKKIDKMVAQIFGELQEFLRKAKNPESVAAIPVKEGKLVEFCTFEDSSLGNTAVSHNIPVIRCTKKHLKGLDVSSLETSEGMLSSGESLDLWGSLPCSPWSQYQHRCVHRYGKAYIRRLKTAQRIWSETVAN